jgi:RNA polymerase sigma-70 factor (ECF subfamily)
VIVAQDEPAKLAAPMPAASSATADFERIFLQHYATIVAVLWRLLGNRAQAEELAGEVFLKLYRQTWQEEQEHNIGGWLYRVATRLGLDALRQRARHGREALERAEQLPAEANPLAELLRAERQIRVRRVLAKMKPARAQLLLLRSQGFSYQEIAQAVAVKPSSVGTLLVRAEAEFAKRYRQMFGDEEL